MHARNRTSFVIPALLILLFATTACAPRGLGTLSGKVTIGPLCPVERDPPDPRCQPTAETFKAWPLAVYDGRSKKVREVVADASGSFMIELPAGTYTVKTGPDRRGLGGLRPVEAIVTAGKTTEISIEKFD